MTTYEIGPLPDDVAAAIDGVIDAMISTAAREVTATGCPLAAAMHNAWGRLAAEQPEVWGVAVLRLQQTDNQEMIAYATLEGAL